MKSTLRNVFIVVLAFAATLCAALGLAACGGELKVTGLEIVNAKTDFLIGDEFTLGDDCVIYAVYEDGSKVDVTAEAELKKENGFDMNVSDEYQITVSFGGKKEVYSIYVSDYTNVLKKIELNTDNVKKQYALGDEISFDGLVVVATYENAQGRLVVFNYTSLKTFNVEIKADDGTIIEDAFVKLGGYTVTVSQGNVKDDYTVNVEGINISNVSGAINVGKIFRTEVVSGTQKSQGSMHGEAYYDEYFYEYKFGDNYTYVKDTAGDGTEYHYSMVDDEIFCARYENGVLASNSVLDETMMDGPVYLLWYNFYSVYGIENTLSELYKAAKECTNNDLEETADEENRVYSFTFSGLKNYASRPDYYETTVSFTLGEKYNVEQVEYIQSYWENNETAAGADWYVPTFITDENGITAPNMAYSNSVKVIVNQTAGERTETNPYSKSMFMVSSYDLYYNDVKLDDPDCTIKCNMSNPNIEILIKNIQPETADLKLDRMLFSYEGNREGYQDSWGVPVGPSKGFLAYRTGTNGDVINVTLKNGGIWKLFIKTENLEKCITFDVTGEAPATMDSYLRNDVSGVFYAADSKTIALNGSVYFYGNVSMGLDNSQSAEITSGNAATATIEKTKVSDTDCFRFSATAAGTYTVKVVSDSNPDAFCEFTFTVSVAPDYATILSGKYTATDLEGFIYEVVFTPESTDPVSGTVLITKTPTETDGTPITDEAKSQTFTYSVNSPSMEIQLVGDIGNTLGVDLFIDAEGRLMLDDVYENQYVMQRVTE